MADQQDNLHAMRHSLAHIMTTACFLMEGVYEATKTIE